MKFTKENILKRLSNWKTWVALFSFVGILLNTFGLTDYLGQVGKVEDVVFAVGVLLGFWTDHEKVGGNQ